MKIKTLSPKEAFYSTKRTQYMSDDVVKTLPQGTGKEVTFFKLDYYVTCQELEDEYKSRGLVASPVDVCAFDMKNPEKMDKMKYVGTQWKDESGNWCFAAFNEFYGKRGVSVRRNDDGWSGGWWFAGVPAPVVGKSAKKSDTKHSSDALPLVSREEALKLISEMEEIIIEFRERLKV